MSVVCVPFREDNQMDRYANWLFLRERWEDAGFWVIVGDNDEERFNCAAARNRAAKDAGAWDVALVADADILLDFNAVNEALELALETGGYVAPYLRLHLLDEAVTARVLEGYEPVPRDAWRSFARSWPCAFAIARPLWDALGGMDAETWKGVGCEDVNFVNRAAELTDLLRVDGDAYHLYHTPRGAMVT
jgi:hypothetical protein